MNIFRIITILKFKHSDLNIFYIWMIFEFDKNFKFVEKKNEQKKQKTENEKR
jgi:hypothetical protein